MRLMRGIKFLLSAVVLLVSMQAARASVFVSVGFAPPIMPVYEQPLCPQPNWIWVPGYWAYGDEGYYWVPGSWEPAPYAGALWTPGYWGWGGGVYVWHPGYWGRHIGYYGGVNYGFGYFGVGFVGGEWHGGYFHYNTAVVHVNESVVRNVYVNRTVINNNVVNNHVSYNGGPGGVHASPQAQERIADHEQHMAQTTAQQQHEFAARNDHSSLFSSNGGHPQTTATARPLTSSNFHAQGATSASPRIGSQANTAARSSYNSNGNTQNQSRGGYSSQGYSGAQRNSAPAQQHSAPQSHGNASAPQGHPQAGGGHAQERGGERR